MTGVDVARRLRNLYLARAGLALLWVTLVVGSSGYLDTLAKVLLVGYPVGDAAATVVELRSGPDRSSTAALRLNLGVAGAAAVGIAVSLTSGSVAVIHVFGAWAIASGAIQAYVAVRRGRSVRGQWFMLVSGGGSVVAGITYLPWAGTDLLATQTLAQYSAGGAAWYLAAAVRMSLRASPRGARPERQFRRPSSESSLTRGRRPSG